MPSIKTILCLLVLPTSLIRFTCTAQENDIISSSFIDVTESHLPLDAKTHALDVALADMDCDGRPDLLLALEKEPNRFYRNLGDGRFEWVKGVFANESHDTEHVRVADFDNDGYLDVVFVAEDDRKHEYYIGAGDGTFKNVSDRLPASSEANGLDVGDVNGDGLMDIIVGNSGEAPSNFLWIGDADKPGFFKESSFLLPDHLDQTQSVKLVDIDDDGDLDVVLGNEGPPSRLYLNDGKGKFSDASSSLGSEVPLHTREVIALDANADGLIDLFFANLTSNAGKKERDPRGRLFINQGEGTFKDETETRIPKYDFSTYAATSIDYDRDGDQDIILSAIEIPPFEAKRVQALTNNGDGVYEFATEHVIPAVTRERSWGIAVGDVNGDEIQDMVIGAWGGQVRLLLGK